VARYHADFVPSLCVAGGLINTAFQIGTAIGLAVCAVARHALAGDEGSEDTHRVMRGLSGALWVSMGLAGLALILAIGGIRGKDRRVNK
jgi:hypothetical protein